MAVLIRTNTSDDSLMALAETMEKAFGVKPSLVADESRGHVDAGRFPKISLTPQVIKGFGFASIPRNWGWFCGDFSLYAAMQACPHATRFLMIEDDVFINDAGATELADFAKSTELCGAAFGLQVKDRPPKYSTDLAQLDLSNLGGCLFPLTIMNRRVVVEMMKLRGRVQEHPHLRVNDEGIFANTIIENGLAFGDLSVCLPALFSSGPFSTNPPFLRESFAGMGDGPLIAHPVLPAARIIDRIEQRIRPYSRFRLRHVLRGATPEIRARIEAALIAREADQA
ncbi:MAG: hypothetical protein AAFU41_14245 [Pseudomonadota bacterium]